MKENINLTNYKEQYDYCNRTHYLEVKTIKSISKGEELTIYRGDDYSMIHAILRNLSDDELSSYLQSRSRTHPFDDDNGEKYPALCDSEQLAWSNFFWKISMKYKSHVDFRKRVNLLTTSIYFVYIFMKTNGHHIFREHVNFLTGEVHDDENDDYNLINVTRTQDNEFHVPVFDDDDDDENIEWYNNSRSGVQAQITDVLFSNVNKKTLSTLGHGVQVRLTENMGYELFATRNFKKGDAVTQYLGRILSKAEADAQEDKTHIMSAEGAMVIDGLRITEDRGIEGVQGLGGGSFANHSDDPNCVVSRNLGVHLVASRDIKINEPITISYGNQRLGHDF